MELERESDALQNELRTRSSSGVEALLHRIYLILLLIFLLSASFVAYSAVKGTTAPRTKAERDIFYYKSLVQKNPKSAQLRISLGQAYLNARNYEEASRTLSEALRLDPTAISARLALGLTYQQMGEWDRAAETLERFLRDQPRNSTALLAMARVKYEKGAYDEALALVKKLQSIDPAEVDAYYLAGQIYERQGRKSQAKEEYRKIFLYDPGSAEAKAAIERLGN